MTYEMAEVRGRVSIRPWRVSPLVDATSATEVRNAIVRLSGVWGGYYMPILDVRSSPDHLEAQAEILDVDSIYADGPAGPHEELLRKEGWSWPGGKEWGPFSRSEQGFRTALLPTNAVLNSREHVLLPIWQPGDTSDLLYAATWGVPEGLADGVSARRDIQIDTATLNEVLGSWNAGDLQSVGLLDVGRRHVSIRYGAGLVGYHGVYIVRAGRPEDVVGFWNLRSHGMRMVGVPDDGEADVVAALLDVGFAGVDWQSGGSQAESKRVLSVWGMDDASTSTVRAIKEAAHRSGLVALRRDREHSPHRMFQGLKTPFVRSVRVDCRPEARWFDVQLPAFGLSDEPDAIARGVVAAEVSVHSVNGLDPRRTASIPPFRRHSSLLRSAVTTESIRHYRVTSEGFALGIEATRDNVRVPFAYNLDVMAVLFDDEAVTIGQSELGKFQTRAAGKLGGAFSGVLNQPGIRAALALTAARATGVTFPHLREEIRRNRGSWPDSLFGPETDEKAYAAGQLDFLLHSGLFVPMLRVHCSHCRVERMVSADELLATMRCELCGQEFGLALSLSLAPSEWRLRLAAHLRPDQVQALMPALAVTGLIRQFRHIEEPPLAHVLGLEVTAKGKTVEVDVAVFIPDRDWLAVLGEVKTSNRIDGKDIDGLENLQRRLLERGVRCMLLFATLKERFTDDERRQLRGLVERSSPLKLASGALAPNLPIVLTGPDLSQPPGSRDHPWRWKTPAGIGYGLVSTAQASCERNLGLKEVAAGLEDGEPMFHFEWGD
ncbi:hypothetical protein [uncultured Cellulomonas sp.]|uniref:hypothetical protein n=1 Tax=uncultured Cellulomonas sp. TaxID=189682 RepID=UPI0026298018|nr:hypothetical protein [uncultured Cellulomonas sp.]